MLQKRDADNARLREQRDQQNAEIIERRQKDTMKSASFEQLKFLAENRGVSFPLCWVMIAISILMMFALNRSG